MTCRNALATTRCSVLSIQYSVFGIRIAGAERSRVRSRARFMFFRNVMVKSATAVAATEAQPPSTSPQQLCGFASPRLCVEGSAAIGSHGGTEAQRAGAAAAGRWTLVAKRRRRQQNMLIVVWQPAAVRSLRELCGSVRDRCSAANGSHGGTEARMTGAAGRWTLVARRRRRQ